MREIILTIGDKTISLPESALDGIDELFRALEQPRNMAMIADWETMTLVPNLPSPYRWENGDRVSEDYELREGKHEK
jgi:hypothetical protein